MSDFMNEKIPRTKIMNIHEWRTKRPNISRRQSLMNEMRDQLLAAQTPKLPPQQGWSMTIATMDRRRLCFYLSLSFSPSLVASTHE